MKILTENYFKKPTIEVARKLLGHYLIYRPNLNLEFKARITEVEAYDGPEDEASHAHRGKTPANELMFGPAGRWYIYLVYGSYYMLNITTGPKDYPAAVLIRGVENLSGPGRLTKNWQINKELNGQVANLKTGLFIIQGSRSKVEEIKVAPRIGIDRVGEKWRQKPYRFYLEKKN